jgi:hypothetical protein
MNTRELFQAALPLGEGWSIKDVRFESPQEGAAEELHITLRENMAEILNYFDNRLTNAVMEGINSIVQTVKRRARGFRSPEYFKTMIYYLCCSGLDLSVPPGHAPTRATPAS